MTVLACRRGEIRTVQPSVHVHQPVKEVLPGIENKDGDEELQRRHQDVVDGLCCHHLPLRKPRGDRLAAQEGIMTTSESAREKRMRRRHVLGNGRGVEAHDAQQSGHNTLSEADTRGPDGDVVISLSNVLWGVRQLQDGARGDLDNLLDNDISGDLISRGVVPLADLLGSMKSVLRKQVERVNDVEEQRHDPVHGDW